MTIETQTQQEFDALVAELETLYQRRKAKREQREVLDRLGECLTGHFDVEHCTFQLEPVGHQAHEPASHA